MDTRTGEIFPAGAMTAEQRERFNAARLDGNLTQVSDEVARLMLLGREADERMARKRARKAAKKARKANRS